MQCCLQFFSNHPLLCHLWSFHFSSRVLLPIYCSPLHSVWPIHFHFYHFISASVFCWLVRFHKFSLFIHIHQKMCIILHRHWSIDTSSLFRNVCVAFKVLALYRNTNLTLQSNIFSFVLFECCVDLHMLFSQPKACLAFFSLLSMSTSIPLSFVTILPRQVNSSTFCIGTLFIVYIIFLFPLSTDRV